MNELPHQQDPPALKRQIKATEFETGGAAGFEEDWLQGAGCLEAYQWLRDQGKTEQLEGFLRDLTDLNPEEYMRRAGLVVRYWLRRDDSHNLGADQEVLSSNDEVVRLADLLRGLSAVVLADAALCRWRRSETPVDLRAFASHARQGIISLARANPLGMEQPPIELTSSTRLPLPLRGMLESVRAGLLDVDNLPSCGWLAVEWLLGKLSGSQAAVRARQEIHLLLKGGGLEPLGLAVPLEIVAVFASHPGLFFDFSAAGALLVHETMRDSLRQAEAWARESSDGSRGDEQASRANLALCLRPRFPRPVFRLSGESAGVLLACGMRAAIEQVPLNRDVTATACLMSERAGIGVAADAVADASVLAKLRATQDREPRLTHVLMEETQADKFRHHRDVASLDITIHGVRSVREAYRYMTREAALDDVLWRHCVAVSKSWSAQVEQGKQQPRTDSHRFDRYVWPRYGILPPGNSPAKDWSTVDQEHEPFDAIAALERQGYILLEEEEEAALSRLLLTHHRLCVTEDAGAGKSVLSWRAASSAAESAFYEPLFGGPPLVVRFEGRWPRGKRGAPLSLEAALATALRKSLEKSNAHGAKRCTWRRAREAVRHALHRGRVMLILDAWDQFNPRQQAFLRNRVLHAAGPLAGCRVLVTSREFAVHTDKKSLFLPTQWRFAKIAGFSPRQQAEYFRDQQERWDRLLPLRDELQDLLQVPEVLRMIRQIIEDYEHPDQLPKFCNRGELYLEASLRLLERALLQDRRSTGPETPPASSTPAERLALLQKVIGLLAFHMCMRRQFNYSIPGPDDHAGTLEEFLDAAFRDFADTVPAYQTADETRRLWTYAVRVLRTIELSHRSVLEVWTRDVLSFRSRKVMEWYAAHYLVNHSTPSDREAAANFTTDRQWYWIWRFALEMPRLSHAGHPARAAERMRETLALLFQPPAQGPPPSELLYRCWHLFEVEQDAGTGHRLPYERDARGRIETLPGAGEVVAAWRWSFWQRFSAVSPDLQAEAIYLLPEDLLWLVMKAGEGSADKAELASARRSLGLDESQLRKLGAWFLPHRAEVLRRWRTVARRSTAADPWRGAAYHPLRAYQWCLPPDPPTDEFPATGALLEQMADAVQTAADPADGEPRGISSHGSSTAHHPSRFQLQTFSVTEAQYQLLDTNRVVSHPRRPVVHVSWFDAWLFSKALGPAFRLPTNSEYDIGASGDTDTDYWWKSNVFHIERCNAWGAGFHRMLDRAESLAAGDRYVNRWGLLHMAGNALQWIQDEFSEPAGNPGGAPGAGNMRGRFARDRICRGGAFLSDAQSCRSTHRSYQPAGTVNNAIGFRLCCTSPPPAAN